MVKRIRRFFAELSAVMLLSFEAPPAVPRIFCPSCSSRLFWLKVGQRWQCDKGHKFLRTDHAVARFQVPTS